MSEENDGLPGPRQIRKINNLAGIGQDDESELGFMARMLVQATLPHTPKEESEYTRYNGKMRLVIQAGPGEQLPSGSYPRLVLAWITREAVRTQDRVLVLGESLSEFMRDLDLVPTGGRWGTITRLRSQMRRLFSARIAVFYDDVDSSHMRSMEVATEYDLWWDPKRPEQAALWKSQIVLGERLFREIITHPVPFDMRILREIKQSPLAIDLYMWTTYRVSYLREPVTISWKRLHQQFGADYANHYDFAKKAKKYLEQIKVAWPELSYETPRGRLKLFPSRPSIPPRDRTLE